MDRNLKLLTGGASVRAVGLALTGPFYALYLRNVLGVPYATIGLAVLLVSVVPLLVGAVGGLGADRLGRRRLLLASLAGEAASLFVVAEAIHLASFYLLAFGVACLGTSSTFGGPSLSAYIADFAEGSERTRAFTWFRIGHNAGFAAGVALGGAAIAVLGFELSALGSAVVAVGALAFLSVALEPSPYDRTLGRSQSRRDAPPPSRGMRESLRALGRDRAFLLLCVGATLASFTEGQWNVTFGLYAYRSLDVSYALLGIGLALNGLIVVFGQSLTTRFAIGHRHSTLLMLGAALYAVPFLAIGVAGQVGWYTVPTFFAALIVITIGENVMSIPMMTLPSNLAPAQEIGAYNGAFGTITGVGMIASSLVGGIALGAIGSPILLWVLLVAPTIPALLVLASVAPRLPSAANRA